MGKRHPRDLSGVSNSFEEVWFFGANKNKLLETVLIDSGFYQFGVFEPKSRIH